LMLAVAAVPFAINFIASMRNGKLAGDNPWRALTLEWMTSSPPPEHNFNTMPIPAPDPYGYGTPEAAAYMASGGKAPVPVMAEGDQNMAPEPPAAGD
jgi:cytochrome c oxidase subunit 1